MNHSHKKTDGYREGRYTYPDIELLSFRFLCGSQEALFRDVNSREVAAFRE